MIGALALGIVAGCGGTDRASPRAQAPSARPVVTAPLPTAAPSASTAALSPEVEPDPDAATPEDAERVLFLATDRRTDGIREHCPVTLDARARIRCLVSLRYADDKDSRALALTLYDETGSLAGLLPEETSDDGRGGKVHLMPARPIGPNRDHLQWIVDAFRDYKRFLDGLRAKAADKAPPPGAAASPKGDTPPPGDTASPADTPSPKKVAFRDRPVDFRFFYTDKGGNPSAFAVRRNVGYNLFGAVNVSDTTVRDTLFHEIFHLNDARLGAALEDALAPIYAKIAARCGKKTSCLAPYAPTDTFVNGAYYAFSLAGSPKEYAAEVGLRYYREHRLLLENKPLPVPPFECGAPENQEAYRLVADTMFAGIDLVPPCPSPDSK